MKSLKTILLILLIALGHTRCMAQSEKPKITIGAQRTDVYLPLLKNKKVALLVNHTSKIGQSHLIDTLIDLKVNVVKIFAPEHGIRGNADAGEKIDHTIDAKSGLPVISLYGKNKKPTPQQLNDVDVVIFDIQDVGVRFYTYISSMHYMMEACAENNLHFIIFDRPNPNGDYIDGPVLQPAYKSFVGMHPIPVVHGLTVGELAQMISGEGWLEKKQPCRLTIVKMLHYTHNTITAPEEKPSPNLPNLLSIRLYPSLCWFEGTDISVARGTLFPFQAIGYPDQRMGSFTFTPRSIDGMSKNPPQKDNVCFGIDLRTKDVGHRMTLEYLLDFYRRFPDQSKFFSNSRFFDLLAGNSELRTMIIDGKTEQEIRQSWQPELQEYHKLRNRYLLYPLQQDNDTTIHPSNTEK